MIPRFRIIAISLLRLKALARQGLGNKGNRVIAGSFFLNEGLGSIKA